jgi:acetyl esterase/lipase
MSQRIFASLILCLFSIVVYAEILPETPLWPNGAPGAMKLQQPPTEDQNGILRNVETPTYIAYLPPKDKANGAAVVICPGGAYAILAMDHEGRQIAEWLNSIGVAGIICKYRCTPFKHPLPLNDAQRAICTVRYHAKDWNIDPQRIGIIGFSAGGHLVSSTGTHFTKPNPDAADPIDRMSNRPDFMILGYPVISFTQPFSHFGSRDNLLGKDADPKLVELMSNEKQVTPETPPTFLVHANDDTGVPPENSIAFYQALRAAKVPVEMHIYLKGGHGFGMKKGSCPAADDWPKRCAEWMKALGFLDAKPK